MYTGIGPSVNRVPVVCPRRPLTVVGPVGPSFLPVGSLSPSLVVRPSGGGGGLKFNLLS